MYYTIFISDCKKTDSEISMFSVAESLGEQILTASLFDLGRINFNVDFMFEQSHRFLDRQSYEGIKIDKILPDFDIRYTNN